MIKTFTQYFSSFPLSFYCISSGVIGCLIGGKKYSNQFNTSDSITDGKIGEPLPLQQSIFERLPSSIIPIYTGVVLGLFALGPGLYAGLVAGTVCGLYSRLDQSLKPNKVNRWLTDHLMP